MDLLKPSDLDIERIVYTYAISNTPHFFYRKLRNDPFVIDIAKYPIQSITKTFIQLGENGIESVKELVYLYALYIALTRKEDYIQVKQFYDNEGAIGLEWFPEIKSIYLSSSILSSTINLSIDNSIFPKVDIIPLIDLEKNKLKHSTTTEINIQPQ
jgi:hypothetical protein